MVMWYYWSADTWFDSCQLTIEWISNIKLHRCLQMNQLTSMGAMLCDVVVVVRTRPRAIYR